MILVTGNQHKLEEFKRLIPVAHWETLGDWELCERGMLGPEIIEDADSFAGNAILKARAGWRRTGIISFADDSGLCVDALDGAPGIYSARYVAGSDTDRYQALLQALSAIPNADRSASFHCALAVCGLSAEQRHVLSQLDVTPSLEEGSSVTWIDDCLIVHGICRGEISQAPFGEGGFGYDPIFNLVHGPSFASLTGSNKDVYSHRGRALRTLARVLL
jgi:XTP/dITP diphosphohydrolase